MANKNPFDFKNFALLFIEDHNEMLEHTLIAMKELADRADLIAIRNQERVVSAIENAAKSKIAADIVREAANDAEKNILESGGGNSAYNQVFQIILSSMKGLANQVEEIAVCKQEFLERVSKIAADSKITAKKAQKAADDAEKNPPESREDNPGYDKRFHNIVSSTKCLADQEKEMASCDQECVERALKTAYKSRIAAKITRKVTDDAEKNAPKLGGGNSAHDEMFQNILSSMKDVAEQVAVMAIRSQESVECAIRTAAYSKIAANITRKVADNAEKVCLKRGGEI